MKKGQWYQVLVYVLALVFLVSSALFHFQIEYATQNKNKIALLGSKQDSMRTKQAEPCPLYQIKILVSCMFIAGGLAISLQTALSINHIFQEQVRKSDELLKEWLKKVAHVFDTHSISKSLVLPQVPPEWTHISEELNQLTAHWQKSIWQVKQFDLNIAHDLRTPLSIIKSNIELLEKSKDRKAAHEQFENVLKAIRQQKSTIDQLSLLHQLQIRRFSPQTERFDIRESLLQAVATVWSEADKKQLELICDITPKGVELSGRKAVWDLCFEHLLMHSIQYSPVKSTIHLMLQPDPVSKSLLLSLEDDGPTLGWDDPHFSVDWPYRKLGQNSYASGLAFLLLREVAKPLRTTISFKVRDLQSHSGLRIEVLFPADEA